MLNQNVAPISDAMKKYAGDGALAFHTPGHKQGLGAHTRLRELITTEGLKQEVSLMEELDDLHEPEGCIKEAEALAAELWGARDTMFMINGTTGAIQAMIMGALTPGDKVLIPRNAHRSLIGGIILAGCEPIYLQPAVEPSLGIPMGLTRAEVQRAVGQHPEAKALLVVYPNYYGYCCDLAWIAETVHKAGMLLLVDEAHGAHLKFSSELPAQALDCGADVVAQSTHKLLGSMTQTSMLHVGRWCSLEQIQRLRQAAGLLQSTSPNQLLLASLDIARLQMAESGAEYVQRAVMLAQGLRQAVNQIPGLYSPGYELCDKETDIGAVALDFAKVTVNLGGLSLTGPEAELILRHEYKIQCELSDPRNLLFIISMADTEAETARLLAALQDMAGRYVKELPQAEAGPEQAMASMGDMPLPLQRMSPREAFFASCHSVELEQALGAVSAETVAFYPPGIPVLCPGEEITQAVIDYIRCYQRQGLRLSGPADGKLKMIKVCR